MAVRSIEEDLQELNDLSERRDRLLNELERFGEFTISRLQAISKELDQFENVRNPDVWEEKYTREKMLILHEEKRRVEDENVDFLVDEIDRRFHQEFKYKIEEKQRKEQHKRDFETSELKRTNQEDMMFMRRELQRLQLIESNNKRQQEIQQVFPPKFGFGVHSPKRIVAKPNSEIVEQTLKDFEKKYYGRLPPNSPTVVAKAHNNLPIMVISVDIGNGVTRNIEVFEHMRQSDTEIHSHSVELAVKFCKDNNLNLEYTPAIGRYIKNAIKTHFYANIPDNLSTTSSESDDDDFYNYGRASRLSPSMPVFTKHSLRSPKGSPIPSPKGSPNINARFSRN